MARLINRMIKITANDDFLNYKKINKFGDEYRNSEGKITTYHILFNDFSEQILSMDKDEAAKFCFKKIKEIQNKNIHNDDFEKYSESDIEHFKQKLKKSNDSLDIIFHLQDKMNEKNNF